jgi:ornithine carbamoyltransferase
MKKIKHFLDLDQINAEELRSIADLSKSYKQGITSAQDTYKGKTLGLIFEKPSTRTRVSFEIAMYQLGGNVTILEHEKTHLGRGETISDTAKVLSRYIDIIVYRTSSAEKLYELAKHSSVPVINGLNDETHPCQLIADIMTFEENIGIIDNRIVTWCGDFNNVCRSWVQASSIFNFKLHLACPKQLISENDMNKINKNKNIKIFASAEDGCKNTDCVMTDTWFSMGQKVSERKRKLLKPFQVNNKLLSVAKNKSIFMHCLPAHRGEEIDKNILEHSKSVIWDEAENRLHTQKAILNWCLK